MKKTRYTQRVEKKMQLDKYHGFPKEVDNYAGDGTSIKITGGDGMTRTKIELKGSYNDRDGHFEWIIEPDKSISHRLFVPSLY